MGHMNITGKKAAFLVESGFCEREFVQAHEALENLGINCRLISVESVLVKSWNETRDRESHWGEEYASDAPLKDALSSDYDILVIPGGRRSIEKLKLDKNIKPFITSFMRAGKPVIAYNQAIDLLLFAELVDGYSFAARGDLCDSVKGGGGRCAAPEFIVSKNLITLSRFRDMGAKLQHAVQCILSGEPYADKVVSSDNMPSAYKAA